MKHRIPSQFIPDDLAHDVPALATLRRTMYDRVQEAEASRDPDVAGWSDYYVEQYTAMASVVGFAMQSPDILGPFQERFLEAQAASLGLDADDDVAEQWDPWYAAVTEARAVSPFLDECLRATAEAGAALIF